MRRLVGALLALVVLMVVAAPAAPAQAPGGGSAEAFRVLVFSKTGGFRHSSIEVGIAAIQRLGRENGFGVDATEEAGDFTAENLRRYGAVIFLNTTGTVLEDPQRLAFEQYVRGGGGYVGIHSAADTEYDWPFYARVIGAYFKNHPLQQTGTFVREDARHPATRHLQDTFTVFDEFYSFRRNPRNDTHVLLRIDESSYSPDPNTSDLPGGEPGTGVMGDHPMSWCHDIDAGRSFYTALGHEAYLYSQDWYLRHVLGGILTAAGRVPADCSVPVAPGSGGGSGGGGGGPSGPGGGESPALRLTRTCARPGRLHLRLSGGEARRVTFRIGRRVVRRDTVAPFTATIARETLRRTRARRLRAVVELRDGSTRRLGRTLPRCGVPRR